jgi:hypothetical protein
MKARVLLAFLAGCGAATVAHNDASTSRPTDASTSQSGDAASPSELGTYDPDAAVTYANAHWDDGVGLCAQFTSACLQAGGLDVDTDWVPTLFLDLAGHPFVEYDANAPMPVGGVPGDVVFYSNASGDDFCIQTDEDAFNCGHVGLVVTAGADGDTATADFHDGALHELPLTGILGGTVDDPDSDAYSTYRVYHLGN